MAPSFEDLRPRSAGDYDPSEALPKRIPTEQVRAVEDVAHNLALKHTSLAQLLYFYRKFEEKGRIKHDTTAWQVLQEIVVPETAQERCPYVDLMISGGGPKMADAMLCHWWGISFRELVLCAAEYASGLLSRAELEAKTFNGGLLPTVLHTTFWLHLLSVNHHAGHPPGQILCETDKTGLLVRHAGVFIVALDAELQTLGRARCLWEVWQAATAERRVHFTGQLAPEFKDGITARFVKRIQDCGLSQAEDREQLLHDIQCKVLLGAFNRQVAETATVGVCMLALKHAMADSADSVDLAKLLHNGAEPDAALTKHGETALMRAVQRGWNTHVGTLLDAKADPNLACAGGWTALHYAVQLGFTQLAEALLAAGADSNAKSHFGQTPLIEAAERGHEGLVEMLMAARGDPELRGEDGKSAAELMRGGAAP